MLICVFTASSVPSIVKRGNTFYAMDKEKASRIPHELVSKELRTVSNEQLKRFLTGGHGYLKLNKTHSGEYSLDYAVRGEGGGALGVTAGAWFGKAIVSVVCHGTIMIIGAGVGLVATPVAGTAFIIAAESTCGAAIETASLAGAIGFGILGGVATGIA
jgi:hypothetical protein